MLDRLPADISRIIISDCLQLWAEPLSVVDVAFCNHARRPDWVSLLRQLRDVSMTTTDAGYRLLDNSSSLDGMLHWVLSRGVHVSRLHLEVSAFESGQVTFSQPMPYVECICLSEKLDTRRLETIQSVFCFLDCFPRLNTINMWAPADNNELIALLTGKMQGRLEGLDLSYCFCLLPDMAASLFCSLGDKLRQLKIADLSSDGVAAIAANCHCLTNLDLGCDAMASSSSLEHLCAVNAGTLTTLVLHYWNCRDAQELVRIISMCSKLVSFTANASIDAAPIVEYLLRHCPAVRTILMQLLTVKVTLADDGQKTVELVVYHHNEDQIALLAAIPFSVRRCQMTFDSEAVATSTLSLESFAPRFRHIPSIIDKLSAHLINCLKHCPHLQELDIPEPLDFVVDILPLIPSLCPKLSILKVNFENQRNSAGLSALIDGYRGAPHNAIKELVLGRSILASDAELHSLAKVFPRLHTFAVLHQKINVSVVSDLIVSGKLKAKRISVRDINALSVELEAHGVYHNLMRPKEIWLPL